MATTTVGRTTIQGATTVGGFNPATLFSAGEQGVWYDPSDLSTLFQDSAGTIPVTALEQPVGRMLDKSGRGNHATQSTNTSFRPVVSARVNLLTYTSQMWTSSVWLSSSGNPVTQVADPYAPDGSGFSAQLNITNSGAYFYVQNNITVTPNTQYTFSFYVRKGTATNLQLSVYNVTGSANIVYLSGDYSSSLSATAFTRVSVTFTTPAGCTQIAVYPTRDGTSNGTAFFWGADLRPTNQGVGLPVYQRVGAAVAGTSTTAGNADYNANGFPVYLSFDGSNDSLATGNINFSSTNKMTVFAGERKTSDVNQGMFAELSVAGGSNSGSFSLFAPVNAGIGNYGFRSRGDGALSVATTASSYPAPITNILTGIGDISGNNMTLRVNGSVAATDPGFQGAGNYGTYPLYIGARAGTSIYFTGLLYGLIVRGASSTANQITGAENWLNQKTAAY